MCHCRPLMGCAGATPHCGCPGHGSGGGWGVGTGNLPAWGKAARGALRRGSFKNKPPTFKFDFYYYYFAEKKKIINPARWRRGFGESIPWGCVCVVGGGQKEALAALGVDCRFGERWAALQRAAPAASPQRIGPRDEPRNLLYTFPISAPPTSGWGGGGEVEVGGVARMYGRSSNPTASDLPFGSR